MATSRGRSGGVVVGGPADGHARHHAARPPCMCPYYFLPQRWALYAYDCPPRAGFVDKKIKLYWRWRKKAPPIRRKCKRRWPNQLPAPMGARGPLERRAKEVATKRAHSKCVCLSFWAAFLPAINGTQPMAAKVAACSCPSWKLAARKWTHAEKSTRLTHDHDPTNTGATITGPPPPMPLTLRQKSTTRRPNSSTGRLDTFMQAGGAGHSGAQPRAHYGIVLPFSSPNNDKRLLQHTTALGPLEPA